MKPNKIFQTVKLTGLLTVCILIATSCENKPAEQTNDPAKQASKENEIKFDNKKLEKDAQFLVDATAFNLEQMQLSRLGEQKGNADIKHVSKMIQQEHTKTLKQLNDFSKNKQISIPDSASLEAQDNYNLLKDKNGVDFNKAFCERMVEGHKKAVGIYEKESTDSRDMDLKEWATTQLPDIRKHLDTIFACQKKLEEK